MTKPEPEQTSEPKRRAYEAPRVLETEEFENLAMVCSRATVRTCPVGPTQNS